MTTPQSIDSVAEVVDKIGRQALARALGIGVKAVGMAVLDGRFPAAWFDTVDRLAAAGGFAVPRDLFNFKNSVDIPPPPRRARIANSSGAAQ